MGNKNMNDQNQNIKPDRHQPQQKWKGLLRLKPRGSLVTAFIVAAIAAAWLGSGFIQRAGQAMIASAPEGEKIQTAKALPAVRTKVIFAEEKQPEIVIHGGKIEAERSVTVRAQIAGRIVTVADQEGKDVSKGDLLCAIAVDSREAEEKQARAMTKLRQLQLSAAKKLARQGHNTRVALAQSEANFENARAMLKRAELALSNTKIVAPFDGVIEKLFVNEGDVMTPGAECAKIIDMSPLVLSGQVAEEEVAKIESGVLSWALLPDGSRLDGHIRYISPSADPKTRTYRIEMEATQPPSSALRDGLTVKIHVPLRPVNAHLIDPSILTLNDKGQLGLRLVNIKDGKSIVYFQPIEIVVSDHNNIWVSGLPDAARIIIVGQDYVKHDTEVVIHEDPPSGSLVVPDKNKQERDL